MAYRKRVKRTPKKRRARVGAVRTRGLNIQKVAGLIAGAGVTALAYQMATKDATNQWIGKAVAGGSIVAGLFLPTFIKSDLFKSVGDGMIAAGGYKMLQEFDVLNGIPFVAGWKELNLINGPGPSAAAVDRPTSANVHREAVNVPFRPTMSQVLNGVYRRRYD